ncbi:TPA: terminase small subunit [Escherichia coli]|nr:terminase small subunit [Escherichia coli]
MPQRCHLSHGNGRIYRAAHQKAMGRILVENLCIDPKLALDAAWRLAQFTHHKKGDTGKKSAKGDAAKKAANRFAVPPPPRLVVNNDNEGNG